MQFDFVKHPGFYSEASVLDMAVMVNTKRNGGAYNFKSLPATAVITISKNVLSVKDRLAVKRIKGIAGKCYLLSDQLMLCGECGSGAPAVIALMEELRVLGVSNFIFVGFAGSLLATNKEGDACFVQKCYSLTGCSSMYAPHNSFLLEHTPQFNKIIEHLKLSPVTCVSTDAPFRETQSLLSYSINTGVTHIEMECAAVYAFAQHYKLHALCIIITADSFSNFKWSLPSDMRHLHHRVKEVIAQIKSR